MLFKKSLKKLKEEYLKKMKEEINQRLKEGDYFSAGIIAENSGSKKLEKLANRYYDISVNRLINKDYFKLEGETNVFPSKECHQNVLDHLIEISEYSLDKYHIKN